MSDLDRKLKKYLLLNGCTFVRSGKGDHEIWFSPITMKKIVVDAGIRSRNMANVVLKQAGLPKQF
jgi:hypothetical protein